MKTYECKICHIRFESSEELAEVVCPNCSSNFIDEVVEVNNG